jgi:dTDP-4-dehydrorhamnose reductase
VHYSSDYVFDGGGDAPWREDAPAVPLNAYGRSKLEGERSITVSGARHLIFRTSWLYGQRGRNFLLTLRRLARERQVLSIVDDQIGAPTWSRHLAQASALAVAQILSPSRGADRPEPWGLYHLCNAGYVSWHGFAQAILELEPPLRPVSLNPVASADYPCAAQRPLNSRLDTGKFERVFGCALPDWREALRDCLDTSAHEASP